MQIIESDVFLDMIDDIELWSMEEFIAARPTSGKLIPGGKGLRKLRWAIPGKEKGKRGGMRVIYYYLIDQTVYLLDAYPKNQKEDLTALEIAHLIAVVEEWKNETSTKD